MKRIIRQDGPKATDRELALQKLRDSQGDLSALTDEEAKAIHVTDFHDSEYEYSINHWLSRRSLTLLEELAEVGIYGEDAAEVGARLVDQALKEFVQRNMEPPMPIEERNAIMARTMTHEELIALQLPEIDFHSGGYEGTINDSLSTQSLYLLDRIAELEIYGESSGEVGARLVDLALQGFVERPRFGLSRNRSN
jgi:hypothetical protein